MINIVMQFYKKYSVDNILIRFSDHIFYEQAKKMFYYSIFSKVYLE